MQACTPPDQGSYNKPRSRNSKWQGNGENKGGGAQDKINKLDCKTLKRGGAGRVDTLGPALQKMLQLTHISTACIVSFPQLAVANGLSMEK